jgi:peptidoglycan hydrolase-like protein with peptidoglycan-binding domain
VTSGTVTPVLVVKSSSAGSPHVQIDRKGAGRRDNGRFEGGSGVRTRTSVVAVLVVVSLLFASPTALAQPVLARGDSGPAVEKWQKDLNRWLAIERPDEPQLVEDGFFGRRTEAATRTFQEAMNIAVDGIVGPETRAALQGFFEGRGGDGGGNGGDKDGLLARGDSGPAVERWQEDLNRWLDAERPKKAQLVVDGIFGRRTERATRAFQKAMDLTVDGIVGPQTRAAMEDYLND